MMCPPGVDQTGRSEQKWQLIAPRIQQSISLTNDGDVWGSDILQNIFGPKNMFGAMEKLARPVRPSYSEIPLTSLSTEDAAAKTNVARSSIESLPVEMVLTIFESGDLSKADILSLALSSYYLRPVIVSYVQSTYFRAAAPWTGTPIASVGNYTLDLPSSFMDNEELRKGFEEWAMRLNNWAMYTSAPHYIGGRRGMSSWKRGMPPSRNFFWDCTVFAKPSSPAKEEMGWRNALKDLEPQCIETRYPREDFESLSRQLACPDLYPKDTEWVLRNLTKKEYYTPQPFPDVARKTWMKGYKYSIDRSTIVVPKVLSFDDVLLMRTCWTSICLDDWVMKKGDWAGDCFDIIRMGVFEKEGWRDVNTELVVEARGCWDMLTGEVEREEEEEEEE